MEPRRAGAVPVLRGRRRPGRGDPGASLGHDGHRVDAQVLAAVAGRHAGRTVARRLLPGVRRRAGAAAEARSEEHTSELQSLMRISYAVFCLKKNKNILIRNT